MNQIYIDQKMSLQAKEQPAISTQSFWKVRVGVKLRLFSLPMLIIGISIIMFSCKGTFDIKPEDSLQSSQMYQNIYDADAAVEGVYGKFLQLAKSYVILNELRADLIDVTPNANLYLQEINEHSVSDNNPYASPAPFYNVILNCNDVLKNLTIMRNDLKITNDEYIQRYSDIGALRSWVYLQLIIHYGSVPYVTQPFEKTSDLGDKTKYPLLPFNQILDSLVGFVSKLPYLGAYPSTASIANISTGGYNSSVFFINKQVLLGDLYLWKGDYLRSATFYQTVLSEYNTDATTYKVITADVKNHNDIAVGYWQRYNNMSIDGLIDQNDAGWRSIFARTQDDLFNSEWIWHLYFNQSITPTSPFVELFANYGEGKYLLKPSQQSVDLWNSQVQFNGFPYDARGTLSYKYKNGQPIVAKYLYEYDELTPFNKPGRWFLYRAAGVQLHYCEAANRDKHSKLALALLNRGIQFEFNPYRDDNQGGIDTVADITEIERTDGPYYGYSFPYNFDGRQDANVSFNSVRKSAYSGLDTTYRITLVQYPVGIRGPWFQNVGIRGRAALQPVLTSSYDYHTKNVNDSLVASIENKLIEEGALELAFEGNRWSDLLRIAIRRDDPSFLADKVYRKLTKAGNSKASAVRAKLLAKNWFLPFKL
jgi:starch-binding outer membrane protein, SusD/RagB family